MKRVKQKTENQPQGLSLFAIGIGMNGFGLQAASDLIFMLKLQLILLTESMVKLPTAAFGSHAMIAVALKPPPPWHDNGFRGSSLLETVSQINCKPSFVLFGCICKRQFNCICVSEKFGVMSR